MDEHIRSLRVKALGIQTDARLLKHDKRMGRYARAHVSEVEALAQMMIIQFQYIELARGENR